MTEDARSLGDLLGDPEWVRSRQQQPRIEAEYLVAALSVLVGEDPDRVLEGLHKDEPLARAVRKLLAVQRSPVNTGGRPRKTDKHMRELTVLIGLEKQGLRGRALHDQARADLGYELGAGPDDTTLRRNAKRLLAKFGGPSGIADLMAGTAAAKRKEDKT